VISLISNFGALQKDKKKRKSTVITDLITVTLYGNDNRLPFHLSSLFLILRIILWHIFFFLELSSVGIPKYMNGIVMLMQFNVILICDTCRSLVQCPLLFQSTAFSYRWM